MTQIKQKLGLYLNNTKPCYQTNMPMPSHDEYEITNNLRLQSKQRLQNNKTLPKYLNNHMPSLKYLLSMRYSFIRSFRNIPFFITELRTHTKLLARDLTLCSSRHTLALINQQHYKTSSLMRHNNYSRINPAMK